jgi:hypothetical protein
MYASRIETDGLFYQVRVIYSDQLHEQNEQLLGGYLSLRDAESSARAHRRDWLIGAITRYVRHKQMLFENSDSSFYNSRKKSDSLRICLNYIREFRNYSLEGIATKIIEESDYFRHILPSPSNPSHAGQVQALEDILSICRRTRKQLKQTA